MRTFQWLAESQWQESSWKLHVYITVIFLRWSTFMEVSELWQFGRQPACRVYHVAFKKWEDLSRMLLNSDPQSHIQQQSVHLCCPWFRKFADRPQKMLTIQGVMGNNTKAVSNIIIFNVIHAYPVSHPSNNNFYVIFSSRLWAESTTENL